MKVKNDLIRIEIGNKKYDFQNIILNEYLKRLTIKQLDKESATSEQFTKSIELKYILLKLDKPILDINIDSNLNNYDFDIAIVNTRTEELNISKKSVVMQYIYKTDEDPFVVDINLAKEGKSAIVHLSNFNNRKITAIGFTTHWWHYKELPICAVLDTSNYNIYLNENQKFTVTRKDIFTTDAEFYTNDEEKVKGPAHLSPLGLPQIIYQPDIHKTEKNDDGTESDSTYSFYDYGKGVLESVGLSQNPNYIEKEYKIGKDVQAINNGTEIEINGIINDEKEEGSIYPSSDLFPSESLYPEECNYKYIIFKYVIYQYVATGQLNSEGNPIQEIKDTGCYYYQAIPLENFKKMKVKIKYERG